MEVPHISNELIHWTGRNRAFCEAFKNLKLILKKNRFLFSSCLTGRKNDPIKAFEKMICFTDIPLSLSNTHCSDFGYFGIALNKLKFISYGANPVFYHTNNMTPHIQNIYYRVMKIREDICSGFINDQSPEYLDYTLLKTVYEFFQSYSYKEDDNDQLNYYQREWRLVLNEKKFLAKQYITEDKNCSYFTFNPTDINFIIVPASFKNKVHEFLETEKLNTKVRIFEEVCCINSTNSVTTLLCKDCSKNHCIS